MEERARGIIAEILGVDIGLLAVSDDITSMDAWNSLAQVRIIAELEYAFDRSIPIEKIGSLKKLGDFVDALSRADGNS
jgi:acyl carrier protein